MLAALARAAGAPADQAGHIYRSIDKLSKIGAAGVRDELLASGLDADAAGRVLDIISIEGDSKQVLDTLQSYLADDPEGLAGVRNLRETVALLPCFGVEEQVCVIDPSLARGLDYYTGAVFESVVDEPKVGSVTGGGRYDQLVGAFAGKDLPTVGTTLGLERIMEVLEELSLVSPPRASADVLVTVWDEASLTGALRLGRVLRAAGVSAEVYLGPPGGLRKQLTYADKLGVPIALIAGPDEQAENVVALRNMATGEQRNTPIAAVAEEVRRALGSPTNEDDGGTKAGH
ncbi:MAG: HisS family protein [Chloroflexia bacterium]